MKGITPCLWFDGQGEEAARFYASVFENSKLGKLSRYDEATAKAAGREAGSALTVEFELDGHPFLALNGGPQFRFDEAISFVVHCEDQAEVDHYWNALTADGGEESMCGWLKDRFGVSWQIVPTVLAELMGGPDPEASGRVTRALMQMRKLDIAVLQAAYDGEAG